MGKFINRNGDMTPDIVILRAEGPKNLEILRRVAPQDDGQSYDDD